MVETGSGAVSRNNVGRSNILVQVQNFNWWQLRVSGCNSQGESQWPAGYSADKRLKERRNFGPIDHLRF